MDIKRKLTRYGYHVLIAIDQLFNALIGGAADETLSSRTYRGAVLAKYPRKRWRIWYRVINALFFDDIATVKMPSPIEVNKEELHNYILKNFSCVSMCSAYEKEYGL